MEFTKKEVLSSVLTTFYNVKKRKSAKMDKIYLMLMHKYRYCEDIDNLFFHDLTSYKKYSGLNELEILVLVLELSEFATDDDYIDVVLTGIENSKYYDLANLYMRFVLEYNAEDIEMYPEDCFIDFIEEGDDENQ